MEDVQQGGLLQRLNPMGLVNTALGIGQSFIDRQTQRLNQMRQNQANIQMADKSYQHDIDMWNRQNEYNSPQAQMERYKQAGLNPNLIYGQGSSGNATTLPRYQTPQQTHNVQPVDLTDMIGRYQDFAVKQAQIDNLKAQKDYTDRKTATEEVRPEWLEAIMRNLGSRTGLNDQMWGFNELNRPAILEYNKQRAFNEQRTADINLYKLNAERFAWTNNITQNRLRIDNAIKKALLGNYQVDIRKKQADALSAEWWADYYRAIRPATQRWIDNIKGGVSTLTAPAKLFTK